MKDDGKCADEYTDSYIDDDLSSGSSDNGIPVPGEGLLQQIFNLQTQEKANELGISMKNESKSKPLASKEEKNSKLSASTHPIINSRKTKSAGKHSSSNQSSQLSRQ